MTLDEFPMTKEIRRTKDDHAGEGSGVGFVIRHLAILSSLVIGHWAFIYRSSVALALALFFQLLTPIHAQPALPNHVLELDGQSGKVEFPAKVFWGLKEFTLETWVKPAQFGKHGGVLFAGSYDREARSFLMHLEQP